MSQREEERLLDLLEKRAFYGLTPEEQLELERLSVEDDQTLDLTASAIMLAEMNKLEAMPDHVRSRIEASADAYFTDRARDAKPAVRAKEEGSGIGFWNWFGWAVAAAACIALAVNIYQTRTNAPQQIAQASPTPTPAGLTPEQGMEQLLAVSTDIARAEIAPGKEDYKPTGKIVWSDGKQAGYIDIKGLPQNDPSKQQYQLWIFDENQDPKTPIDGGVFNVKSDGEVVIPIDAKLKVKNPKVFAITVEKPGGVVVSKQEHVAALAKVET